MDYPVFTHKIDTMKKLQQLVARGGYSRYQSGTVEAKGIEKLLAKFEDRYQINATKNQRYYAKKNGEANSSIVLWLDGEQIHFWLMVTPGESLVTELEDLLYITDKKSRITITGYELVRIQRAEKSRWTWRMTKENYADFEQRIIDACKHQNTDHIRQIQYSLERMPCFAETRSQAFALHKKLKATYKRFFDHAYGVNLLKNFYGRYKLAETRSAVEIGRKARRLKLTLKQRLKRDLETFGFTSISDFENAWQQLEENLSEAQANLEKHQTCIEIRFVETGSDEYYSLDEFRQYFVSDKELAIGRDLKANEEQCKKELYDFSERFSSERQAYAKLKKMKKI